MTNRNNTLIIGGRFAARPGLDQHWPGELALFRVSKRMAEQSQIQEMYRQELQMFQPDAKVTLQGDSQSITAVLIDEHGMTHAGTTDGKSVFSGITRVSENDSPINNFMINTNFKIEQ
jgi:ligand-binding sensor domain-containing protein